MKMKNIKTLIGSAILALGFSQSANAILSMTIEDVVNGVDETFTDAATPGNITVTIADSAILEYYYDTGSIQSVISNYISTDTHANLISSSINLNGASIFDDAVIVNLVGEYTQPEGSKGLATTTVNAATNTDASYDATVTVSNTTILTELDIVDLGTYSATETVDLIRGAGDVYPIRHAFRLSSTDVGSDLGFDISTRVDAVSVPVPAPLALLGLGLVGMTLARKMRK